MTSSAPDEPFVWNVAGLLRGESGAHRDYDIGETSIDLPEDLVLSEPIAGHVRLTRTNRGVLADADLTTALAMECVRCLRPAVVPLDAPADRGVPAVHRPRERRPRTDRPASPMPRA